MKIIVDAMGGDNAPQAIVQGALDAHKACGVDILLVGRAAEVLNITQSALSHQVKALEEQLGHTIHTSPLTQYVGALGAALFAYKRCKK